MVRGWKDSWKEGWVDGEGVMLAGCVDRWIREKFDGG